MLDKLRNQLSQFIAPSKSIQQSQKSGNYYGNPFFSSLGKDSGSQLESNKFGAANAVNLAVPVYSATNIRVKTVARTFWSLKDSDGNILFDSESINEKHILGDAIRHFEQEYNFNFFGAWELSRVVAGETYIYMIPNEFGVVRNIEWLNPLGVSVYAPQGNILEYWYEPHFERMTIPPRDMLFDRQLNLVDENIGQSPVEVAIRKAQIIINGDNTMLAHLKNNARMGMAISPRLNTNLDPKDNVFTDDEMNMIQNALIQNTRGSANANTALAIPIPTDITTYEMANVSPIIELMDRVDKSVYEALGVPPSIAGNPDTSRFQRSEQDLIVFHQMIENELLDIQRYMNRVIIPRFDPLRRTKFEFDLSPFQHLSEEDLQTAELTNMLMASGLINRKHGITLNSGILKRKGLDIDELINSEPESSPLDDPEQEFRQAPTKKKEESHHHDIEQMVDATTPGDWSYEGALKELKAYRKFIRNGSHLKKTFQADYLTGELEDSITALIATASKKSDVTYSIDAMVVQLKIEQKSIGGLREEFKSRFKTILDNASTRGSFFAQLNALVDRMGTRAYKEGLEASGVRDDPNTDDNSRISVIQSRQVKFINNLADKLFSDAPPTELQLTNKPEQWANKTLMSFYHDGLLSGRRNPMLKWVWSPEKEHCKDCERLNGQVHRANAWKRSGWQPQDSKLECNGDNCGCEYKRSRGRTRGRF